MRCSKSLHHPHGACSKERPIPTLDTSGLIIAYVVIAALLLGLNLNASWHWLVKSLVTLIVAAFFFVTYHSWPGVLGWPTTRDLPKQFYLHAINVDEPNRIYFWGTDLGRGLGKTVPRSYGVPYTASLHDKANKASRKLRKGLPVIGQVGTPVATADDVTTLEQAQTNNVDIEFVDAPQNLIPGKN